MPLQVIGTDGGLLPAVATRSYVMLMPGERVDLWADFTQLKGKQVVLRSLSFDPGMGGGRMGGGGMGGGGMGGGCSCGSSLAMGAAFNILTVFVGQQATSKPVLGPLPPLSMKYDASNVENYSTPTTFTLEMQRMIWTINHRVGTGVVLPATPKARLPRVGARSPARRSRRSPRPRARRDSPIPQRSRSGSPATATTS